MGNKKRKKICWNFSGNVQCKYSFVFIGEVIHDTENFTFGREGNRMVSWVGRKIIQAPLIKNSPKADVPKKRKRKKSEKVKIFEKDNARDRNQLFT